MIHSTSSSNITPINPTLQNTVPSTKRSIISGILLPKFIFTIALILFGVMGSVGCGDDPPTAVPKAPRGKRKKRNKAIEVESPIRQSYFAEPFDQERQAFLGGRSPFSGFVSAAINAQVAEDARLALARARKSNKTLKPQHPLQKFDLQQLKLIATLSETSDASTALFIIPTGERFAAQIGDPIGPNGEITAIRNDEVKIRLFFDPTEIIEEDQKEEKRCVRMRLNPSLIKLEIASLAPIEDREEILKGKCDLIRFYPQEFDKTQILRQ